MLPFQRAKEVANEICAADFHYLDLSTSSRASSTDDHSTRVMFYKIAAIVQTVSALPEPAKQLYSLHFAGDLFSPLMHGTFASAIQCPSIESNRIEPIQSNLFNNVRSYIGRWYHISAFECTFYNSDKTIGRDSGYLFLSTHHLCFFHSGTLHKDVVLQLELHDIIGVMQSVVGLRRRPCIEIQTQHTAVCLRCSALSLLTQPTRY